MGKETKFGIVLVIGLILVALSRFHIMSQPIAIIVGGIGALVIVLSAIQLFRNRKSKS